MALYSWYVNKLFFSWSRTKIAITVACCCEHTWKQVAIPPPPTKGTTLGSLVNIWFISRRFEHRRDSHTWLSKEDQVKKLSLNKVSILALSGVDSLCRRSPGRSRHLLWHPGSHLASYHIPRPILSCPCPGRLSDGVQSIWSLRNKVTTQKPIQSKFG